MNFSLNQALDTLSPENQPKSREKINRLIEYLRSNYNTELRDDSRLAWVYATSLPETELDSIGREIWHTKLLYSYTNYADICKEILPLVKLSLLRRHRPTQVGSVTSTHLDDQQAWEHIQNYVLPSIQLDCMSRLMERAGLITDADKKNK